jgi:hypothetical protein
LTSKDFTSALAPPPTVRLDLAAKNGLDKSATKMSDMEDQPVDMFNCDGVNNSPNWVFRPRTHPKLSPESSPVTENAGTALIQRDAMKEESEQPTETTIDSEKEALKSSLDQCHIYILFLLSKRVNDVDQATDSSTAPNLISNAKALEAYAEVARTFETRIEELQQQTHRVNDELRRAQQKFQDKMTRMEQEIADKRKERQMGSSHTMNNINCQVQTGFHAQQFNVIFQGIPPSTTAEQRQLPLRPAQRDPQ